MKIASHLNNIGHCDTCLVQTRRAPLVDVPVCVVVRAIPAAPIQSRRVFMTSTRKVLLFDRFVPDVDLQ